MTPQRVNLVLAVLFVGAFTMGCAEMLVVGMLDLISVDLDVSLPAAGALVTANALGLALGGPLLTFLTTRFDRRTVLLATLVVFALANLLPTLAADYPVFLAGRVVIGAAQGLFIAAAMVTATSIVSPARAGRAMAIVISGFATASALGLPLGTLLGQAVGWRVSFGVVVAVGTIILVAAFFVLPRVPAPSETRALGQARHALAPRVLAVLAVAALLFAAMLSAITYLVPFLADVSGVSGAAVSGYLLAYGVATAIGSFVGGHFADSNASRALIVGGIGVTLSLLAMVAFGANALLVLLAVIGIGLFGMGAAPSIQYRVVSLAGPGAPLASSLPASAVNVGIALGSLAGGAAIADADVTAVAITGAAIAIVAVVCAWATSALSPARVSTTAATV